MEPTLENKGPTFMEKVMRILRIIGHTVMYLFDHLIDMFGDYWYLMKREAELFIGTALLLIGLLSFHNGKNCDGNTAEYLSCTRPSTFYYFSGFEIFIIVLGIFFILFWHLKNKHIRGHNDVIA